MNLLISPFLIRKGAAIDIKPIKRKKVLNIVDINIKIKHHLQLAGMLCEIPSLVVLPQKDCI